MAEIVENFIQQVSASSALEWLAVSLAMLYLLLAIKENPWCWLAAFFSTSIYVFLFFDINLYMESFLNVYYLLMAVYGWQQWHQGELGQTSKKIISWPIKYHLLGLFCCLLLIATSFYLLNRFTQQDYPLLDATTTWLAIFTTYMVTQKVLENWIYWIVIDLLSVYLYLQKDLALTAVLFVGYVLLAIFGWRRWKKHYNSVQGTMRA